MIDRNISYMTSIITDLTNGFGIYQMGMSKNSSPCFLFVVCQSNPSPAFLEFCGNPPACGMFVCKISIYSYSVKFLLMICLHYAK